MRTDVVVADRCPTGSTAAATGGSMVGLIRRGLSNSPGTRCTIWVSPTTGDQSADLATSDARLLISRVHVSKETLDDYYLTVGAGRVWMVLHNLSVRLSANALEDLPWQRFVEVNRCVAAAAAKLARLPQLNLDVHKDQIL